MIDVELPLFDYSKELFLPVQALRDKSIEYVLGIDCIYEMADIESVTNDLSKNILFIKEINGIRVPGEIKKIDGKYEIRLSITFCQFMWSVALYVGTVFDNCVHIPAMDAAGTNIHSYRVNRQAVEFANDSFFRARQLLRSGWHNNIFFVIPNICDPQAFKNEIETANAVMIGGVAFMFAHELAHNMLGHTHINPVPSQVVKDEIDADNTAFSFLSETFDTEDGYTNKVGMINLLCSLLLLSKDSVSGGKSHPHMDIRIDMMMQQMKLDKMDLLWGYVGNAIRLWLLCYGGYSIQEDMELRPFDYYKNYYEHYLRKLRETRDRLFPDFIKPDWYC